MSWENFKARFSAPFHSLELQRCGSDLERMWAVLDLALADLTAVRLTEAGPGKSTAAFGQWKEKGNDLLACGRLQEACTAYTRALFFAPGPEERAVAFGNRSAALLQLGLASDCLRDIEACLDSGYPAAKRFRLLNRSGECRLMLGEPGPAGEDFRAALELLTSGQCDLSVKQAEAWRQRVSGHLGKCGDRSPVPQPALRRFRCDRPTAPALAGGRNAKLPSASDAVEVRTSAEDGRGLYARRNIAVGEVLVAERPYAFCLVGECFLSHCARCLLRCPTLRPCRACAHVGFCSAGCEEEAWSRFHRFECPVIAQLASLPNLKMVRLAYRTLIQTDPVEIRRVVGEAASGWAGGEADSDFSALFPGEFASDDYLAAFSIVGNSVHRSSCDLTERALLAVFLLLCAAKAGFVTEPLERSEAAIIGAALLRHLQSLPCNAHEVSEKEVPASGDLKAAVLQEVGSGLFPLLSLVNHSCDPNVHRVCFGEVCVLRCLRSLAPGDQLLDCYSQHFAVRPKEERQSALSEQYFFTCRCPACEGDWPLYEELCQIAYPGLLVPQLSPGEAKAWEKFSDRLSDMMALLAQGRDAFCAKDETEKYFICYQNLLCRLVKRPWKELNNNEECLKVLWNLKGNCFQNFQ